MDSRKVKEGGYSDKDLARAVNFFLMDILKKEGTLQLLTQAGISLRLRVKHIPKLISLDGQGEGPGPGPSPPHVLVQICHGHGINHDHIHRCDCPARPA